ncbi:MAG: hypothetical protein K6E86_06535 [Bacteroidales bacterium]|nr:hypothetical protein [Bacteroidales bacterium]
MEIKEIEEIGKLPYTLFALREIKTSYENHNENKKIRSYLLNPFNLRSILENTNRTKSTKMVCFNSFKFGVPLKSVRSACFIGDDPILTISTFGEDTLIMRLVCDWNAIGARLVIPIESYTNPDTIAGESRAK